MDLFEVTWPICISPNKVRFIFSQPRADSMEGGGRPPSGQSHTGGHPHAKGHEMYQQISSNGSMQDCCLQSLTQPQSHSDSTLFEFAHAESAVLAQNRNIQRTDVFILVIFMSFPRFLFSLALRRVEATRRLLCGARCDATRKRDLGQNSQHFMYECANSFPCIY